MRVLGIILIVLGLAGLVYGGFTYTDKDTADLGIAEVTVTETERVNIHPAIGGAVLVVGILMLVLAGRKTTYVKKVQTTEQ